MTPEMCRAGLALLNWDTATLAEHAGVTRATVSRFLNGGPDNSAPKLAKAFSANGVTFTNGPRVQIIKRVKGHKASPDESADDR